MKNRILKVVLLFTVLAASCVVMWRTTYEAALHDLHLDAEQEIEQAVDQFQNQLSRARMLPTLLARNETVERSVTSGVINETVRQQLTRAHDLSSANAVRLLGSDGSLLLSSVQNGYSVKRSEPDYFTTAMNGSLGVAISYEEESGIRSITFARSVIPQPGKQSGVVAIDVALEPLETSFRARPYTFLLADRNDTVLFSNRATMLFKNLAQEESSSLGPYPPVLVSQIEFERGVTNGVELWNSVPDQSPDEPVVVVRRALLTMGLQALLLLDSSGAKALADRAAALTLVTGALIAMSAFALFQHRRQLVDRINAEHELNAELDHRVAMRSAELEKTQSQLVQAEKLSALGTMSAGISHELNQPVAAIQNFAFMARRLITDKLHHDALSNLEEIERQTERMSRIIRNLRDFARKDEMPRSPVNMADIIRQATAMSEPRLKTERVSLSTDIGSDKLWVLGGKVRLQQVLLNLINNAIDAQSSQKDKQVEISTSRNKDTVCVRIADNGPGITEPDRVFEPFYSTKSGATDDGLGLGLSISYGLVESFGGSLRATNQPSGGALFTLTLPSSKAFEGGTS